MKTFIFSLLSFIIGGSSGCYLGNKLAKRKYLKMADDEIESVKKSLEKYYEAKLKPKSNTSVTVGNEIDPHFGKQIKVQQILEKPVKNGLVKEGITSNKENYMKYVHSYDKNLKEEKPEQREPVTIEPYVISPEEFTDGDYDVRTLYYYKDGVLADDEYNVIRDIKGHIGNEALETFGTYNEDTVYVRNETQSIDYEVIWKDENFNDISPRNTIGKFPGDDEQ